MSEQFNNKDYAEYFSALERSIEKQSAPKQTVKPNVSNTQKRNKIRFKPWVYVTAVALVIVLVIIIASASSSGGSNTPKKQETENSVPDVPEKINYFAEADELTAQITDDIDSKNIIMINCDTNKVVAARNEDERCYPASTTKIMTILTAVDYVEDYNKTFTFSYKITDPYHEQEATMAGFANGEAVNVTDMLYGAILPSGADATVGLAITIAGSEEEFVNLMNKKAGELGLKNTHFTNASGLYDKNHYTTPEDMAVIVRAAMDNELCRKVLSTYEYTTAATPQHPEGIALKSTLFSHMYGTEPEGADILGGKTGFVNQSGYCIASFGHSDGGTNYVCVTLNGLSLWPTIYDQIDLYTRYAK